MVKTHKQDETTTTQGKYVESGPRGGKISNPIITTIEKRDKPFPLTRKQNLT